MNTPLPSRWPELFDMAMAIIDQANAQGIGMNSWSFGGGTALMLQINHRESHDIDLFIEDAQYLPYLNPGETQGSDIGTCAKRLRNRWHARFEDRVRRRR